MNINLISNININDGLIKVNWRNSSQSANVSDLWYASIDRVCPPLKLFAHEFSALTQWNHWECGSWHFCLPGSLDMPLGLISFESKVRWDDASSGTAVYHGVEETERRTLRWQVWRHFLESCNGIRPALYTFCLS